MAKVMEKCLYSNIIDPIKPLLHPLQHGLMNGKSCTTRLLDVYENVGKCLDEGKQMLLHKLKKLGFSGELFDWLSDYLQYWFSKMGQAFSVGLAPANAG